MSPWNMKNSVRKIEAAGNQQILLADRGTFFGYNMLVNDMTSFPIMSRTGYPVSFDATHSIQLPTSMGNISGGQREFIPYLVRAAVACGVNACTRAQFSAANQSKWFEKSDAATEVAACHCDSEFGVSCGGATGCEHPCCWAVGCQI